MDHLPCVGAYQLLKNDSQRYKVACAICSELQTHGFGVFKGVGKAYQSLQRYRASRRMAGVRAAGLKGEEAVRAVYDIGDKAKIDVPGTTRKRNREFSFVAFRTVIECKPASIRQVSMDVYNGPLGKCP